MIFVALQSPGICLIIMIESQKLQFTAKAQNTKGKRKNPFWDRQRVHITDGKKTD
jgi:hypothetical protein